MLFDAKLVEKKSWWVRIFPFWMLLAPAVDTGTVYDERKPMSVLLWRGYICVGYAIRGWQLGWRDRAAGDLSPGQGQGGHGGHQVSFILHHQNWSECWTSLVPYFRKQWGGSGSALWETSWCRIRMEDTDSDLKDKNSPQKNELKNYQKYKIKKRILKCKIYRTVPAFIKFRYCKNYKINLMPSQAARWEAPEDSKHATGTLYTMAAHETHLMAPQCFYWRRWSLHAKLQTSKLQHFTGWIVVLGPRSTGPWCLYFCLSGGWRAWLLSTAASPPPCWGSSPTLEHHSSRMKRSR